MVRQLTYLGWNLVRIHSCRSARELRLLVQEGLRCASQLKVTADQWSFIYTAVER